MQNKTKIDGISSLIDDLKKVYEEARNGELKLKDARDIANVAGKIIKASSVKLDYNKYKNSDEEIDFLK
jgi:hypothetical protein